MTYKEIDINEKLAQEIDAAMAAARARGGARRISKRSELRLCDVVDSCGGLLTPEGEYVVPGDCWDYSAEWNNHRELSRGRTLIKLPIIYKPWQ